MSKKIRFKNGYTGVVSDAAAEILAKRPGVAVLGEAPKRKADKDEKDAKADKDEKK